MHTNTNGKGDRRRKQQVPEREMADNWAAAFPLRCPGCGNEIDPDLCYCGNELKGHGFFMGHYGVPIGCDCHRAKEDK